MNKAAAALLATLSMLIGCQTDDPARTVETISVAAQLQGNARYDIDLTREDAVFVVEAGLDASRMSVTCPTLRTMSFSDYVVNRIHPTSPAYEPAKVDLVVASGAIPEDLLTPSGNAFSMQECKEGCVDRPDGSESCILVCE